MSGHLDILQLLLPPDAYNRVAPNLAAELHAEANQLDGVQNDAASLLLELDPRTTVQLLPDWERVYGLPDAGLIDANTVAERQARLTAKWLQTGGLSRPYFQAMLEQAGYTVLIDEPRGFFTGVNRCGDRLYSPPACAWYWRVRLRKNGQVLSAANKSRVRAWLESVKAAYSFVDLED